AAWNYVRWWSAGMQDCAGVSVDRRGRETPGEREQSGRVLAGEAERIGVEAERCDWGAGMGIHSRDSAGDSGASDCGCGIGGGSAIQQYAGYRGAVSAAVSS